MSNDDQHLVATYRVQLTPSFGFADTIGILDHLVRLGVSHLYLSPVAEAAPGSLHGYDVIDHTVVRTDFGGESGLSDLLDAAGSHGLGVVIDHVPNHMAAAEAHLNPWWWEMLRDGPASPAAAWFDVDWAATDGRVLVPKLGDPLDDVLAAGGITIGDGDLGPEVRYGPLRFPLASGTESLPVADALERQHYELMWWRDPRRNVRRFFTIDDLVAVRAENPDVAEVIDTIPARLADHPAFAGVRVDHVDGLADPEAYLHGLRRRIGDDRWLLVEKILAPAETLAPSWPVDGTTGYEHIRATEHAFLDPAAEQPLTTLWTDLTEDHRSFADIEDQARREVLDGGLRPDLDRLVRLVVGDVGKAQEAADVGERVRQALVELTIGVHRYRTYLPDDPASLVELDSAHQRALEVRGDLAEAARPRRRPDPLPTGRGHTLGTTDQPGDGQGGRGPRLLPVSPCPFTVRSRWLAGRLRPPGRRVPSGERRRATAHADDDARWDDTRHQTIRGRARPFVGSRRDRRRLECGRAPMDRAA